MIETKEQLPANRPNLLAVGQEIRDGALDRLSPDQKRVAARFFGGSSILRLFATLGILTLTGCTNIEKLDINLPIVTVPVVESISTPIPTPEPKPERLELPKDIVSANELQEKYNTRIWNVPETKLHIRRAALVNELIFQNIKERRFNGLDIVLVDGPFVHTSFLTPEQRNGLPGLVNNLGSREKIYEEQSRIDFKKRRELIIQDLQKQISELEVDLKNGKINQDLFNVQTEAYKYSIRTYMDGPTQYDLMETRIAGLYAPVFESRIDPLTREVLPKLRIYILLAVGKSVVGEEKVFRSGQAVTIMNKSSYGGIPLNPKQSYPSPESYELNLGFGHEYPVGRATKGFSLRHEMAHGDPSDHPQTDLIALERIRRAYDAYKKGDDTQYYFVFETPEGNIFTGVRQPVNKPSI